MVLIAAHLNAGVILVGGESVVVDNLPLPKKLTAHNNSVLKNTHVHTLRNTPFVSQSIYHTQKH